MKYIYILGLEHSGTTLTDHLLSAHPEVVGLGEVAQFFSPSHMQNYLERWGSFDVHDICSCGKRWSECEFWRPIENLNGSKSTASSASKYKALIEHFKDYYGDSSTIVDSSKSLSYLTELYSNLGELGLYKTDFSVVVCVKDPRGYVTSMKKKAGDTYESLCADASKSTDANLSLVGLGVPRPLKVSHNNSHIVIGNKDFTMYGRSTIKYDNAWTKEVLVRLAYMFHWKARHLNKKLASMHKLADKA